MKYYFVELVGLSGLEKLAVYCEQRGIPAWPSKVELNLLGSPDYNRVIESCDENLSGSWWTLHDTAIIEASEEQAATIRALDYVEVNMPCQIIANEDFMFKLLGYPGAPVKFPWTPFIVSGVGLLGLGIVLVARKRKIR